MLCSATLHRATCICNALSPFIGSVGELIGVITYTSNLGNLAMEVMDDLFLFFVLGHVETQMIGDDRPYSLVLRMMSNLTMSFGMVPKFTYKRFPPKA